MLNRSTSNSNSNMASSPHSSHSATAPAPATDALFARSSGVAVDVDGGAGQKDQLIRRGPWTVDEDLALVNYVAAHGEGRWNSLAATAGLKRTGKSCRLRWLNYLRPDVKRGNFTADEQMLILDLHSRYGNRWSKIAQHLPGRTDNEIKNYWRTRVQKHAKQLNCDANSKRFKDAMRYLWMPHLVDGHCHHLHAADHQQQATATAANHDGYYHAATALSAGAMGVPSSSSDSFATTTSESYEYDAGFPPNWEPSSCYDSAAAGGLYAGEMLMPGGGGDCWVQETSQQQAGMMWPEEQKAAVGVNGGQFEDAELSGWVQSFSEAGATAENTSFWTLEDVWKTQ